MSAVFDFSLTFFNGPSKISGIFGTHRVTEHIPRITTVGPLISRFSNGNF